MEYPDHMSVEELADTLGIPTAQIIRVLAALGELERPDSTLSSAEVELMYEELGLRFEGSDR